MKRIIIFAAAVGLVCSSAFAQDSAPTPVPFVSINMIDEGGNASFNAYTANVLPIMQAHNSNFSALTVTEVLTGDVAANSVVTIGQFGSREDSQLFRQDPAFLAIFPDLVAPLDDHIVVFPDGPLPTADDLSTGTEFYLTYVWTDAAIDDLYAYNEQVNADLADVIAAHRGTRLGVWQGAFASRGLGESMTPETAPQLIELWSFDDVNAFMADAAAVSLPEPHFAVTRQFGLRLAMDESLTQR